MPYISTVIDRVVLVKWQTPTAPDVLPVLQLIREARERLGTLVIGIAIIPEGTPPPSNEARPLMGKCLAEMLQHTESLHYVVEGSGFRGSLARGVISSVTLLSGKRGHILVHPTLDEALRCLKGKIAIGPEDFFAQARNAGIVAAVDDSITIAHGAREKSGREAVYRLNLRNR